MNRVEGARGNVQASPWRSSGWAVVEGVMRGGRAAEGADLDWGPGSKLGASAQGGRECHRARWKAVSHAAVVREGKGNEVLRTPEPAHKTPLAVHEGHTRGERRKAGEDGAGRATCLYACTDAVQAGWEGHSTRVRGRLAAGGRDVAACPLTSSTDTRLATCLVSALSSRAPSSSRRRSSRQRQRPSPCSAMLLPPSPQSRL